VRSLVVPDKTNHGYLSNCLHRHPSVNGVDACDCVSRGGHLDKAPNTLVLTAYMHSKYRLSRREATAESTTSQRTNFVEMDFAENAAEYIRLRPSENEDKRHCDWSERTRNG